MRRKSLNFIIGLEVYPFDIMFSFGETDEQLRKAFKRVNHDPLNYFDHPLHQGRCTLFDNGYQVLRLRHYPWTSEQYGFLQHEIFHAVSHVMETIGMPLVNGTSDEAFAYLIAFITRKVYEKLNP